MPKKLTAFIESPQLGFGDLLADIDVCELCEYTGHFCQEMGIEQEKFFCPHRRLLRAQLLPLDELVDKTLDFA